MSNITDLVIPPKTASSEPVPFRFGTVTQESPLRVQLDGDTSALPITPVTLVPLTVGERVFVSIINRRITVIGAVGGPDSFARLGSNAGVNIPQTLVLGPNGNNEASYRLQRQYDASNLHEAYSYITNTSGRPVFGLITRVNGLNHARLWFDNTGQVSVNTYSDSPTTTATRPLPFAMATGTVSIAGTGTTSATASVTFPSGRFTSTPVISLTAGPTAGAQLSANISSVSSSGMTVRLHNSGTTFSSTHPVHWIAIQLEV